MAIAFNAALDLGNNGGASGLTAGYTCSSGSNRLLIVFFTGDLPGGADDITSVTYGGAAMTLAKKDTVNPGSGDRIPYMYYLLNPASGFNNVIISTSSPHYLLAGAADYTGVQQSAQPDATSSAGGSSALPFTTSLTTVADNSWSVLLGPCTVCSSGPSGGTGSTLRATETVFKSFGFFDSNAAITPAGSHSMTITGTATAINVVTVMASFAPATGALTLAGASGSFALTGEASTFKLNTAAGFGSFALTGEAATFLNSLNPGFGAFTLTGEPVTFSTTGGFTLAAANGSFALTGGNSSFAIALAAAMGAVAETGQPATFLLGTAMQANTGTFTLTPQVATFKTSLVSASGSFIETGQPATLATVRYAETVYAFIII